jgi:hypothetical protein
MLETNGTTLDFDSYKDNNSVADFYNAEGLSRKAELKTLSEWTREQKIIMGIAVGLGTAIIFTPYVAPFAAAGYYDTLGNITNNPENYTIAHHLRVLEGLNVGGTGLILGINQLAQRLRIQKTPESILITMSKHPIDRRPQSSKDVFNFA